MSTTSHPPHTDAGGRPPGEAPPGPPDAPVQFPGITWVHWRDLGVAMAAVGVLAGLLLLLAPQLEVLALYLLFSVPSNSFLAIPNEPGLLIAVNKVRGVIPRAPLWLALTGAFGAGVAALLDYNVIRTAFEKTRLEALRRKRLFVWAVGAFNRAPSLTVLAFAVLPLPFYIVRVLAPNSGLPRERYVAAVTVGRFGRYLVVAAFGFAFKLPSWLLWGIIGAIVIGAMWAPALGWLNARRARRAQRVEGAADQPAAPGSGE